MKRLSILFKKNLNRQHLMKAKLFPFSMASFVHSFVSFANSQKKKKKSPCEKDPVSQSSNTYSSKSASKSWKFHEILYFHDPRRPRGEIFSLLYHMEGRMHSWQTDAEADALENRRSSSRLFIWDDPFDARYAWHEITLFEIFNVKFTNSLRS